jgi:hypothetical protein
MNEFNIKSSINSDSVIGFTSAKAMKSANFVDAAKVSAYLMQGKDSHRKHLGMIDLYNTTHEIELPFMRDLFKSAAVLEVAEGESITYDLPVNNKEMLCYTLLDTSDFTDNPGIDGSVFPIILSFEFTKGDVLTYDAMYGEQIIVSNDHVVERVGEGFKHWVQMITNNRQASFPKEYLKPGIQWMKIDHRAAEFDQGFSGITLLNEPAGTLTCEFLLGSPRGVETFTTARAARMKAQGLNAFTEAAQKRVDKHLDALGGKSAEMFFWAQKQGKGVNKSTIKVGTTLEYLAMMELATMECHSLLFAKAAAIQTAKGLKRTNEGVWHQIRRGKVISYSRPGGLTWDHIQEAVNYVYRNSPIPVAKRRVKFKAGAMAYANFMQLIREEALTQLNGLPAAMLGNDKQIPEPVLSGSLDRLKMAYVAIEEVPVPGLGIVSVEHDPSLDYNPFADRNSAGFYGEGFNHTTHSLIMWDVTDPEYSNVNERVKGANLVEGGAKRANIYYVKPEGAHVVYGYNHGRMAFQDNPHDVMASMNYMGSQFWAYSQSGALVLDTTRYVSIELDRNTIAR